jgi:hypothetical protein
MRFILYGPAVIRGAKIDWEAEVRLTQEIREALRPQDPELLRAGRLRRPFHVKPPRVGTRAQPVARDEIVHPKGALVFASRNDRFFFFEASDRE